jgi:hypothetical protein
LQSTVPARSRPPSDADTAQAHQFAKELASLIADAKARLSELDGDSLALANGELSARAAARIRFQKNECDREIAALQMMAYRLRCRFPALTG